MATKQKARRAGQEAYPTLALFGMLVLAPAGIAQQALPGCEPNTEVLGAVHGKLAERDLDQLKFTERAAREHAVLEELIARYPREAEPHRLLIGFVGESEPDQLPALRARYRKIAAEHPDDPLALYLASLALVGADTPERIRLLESARKLAPQFAWPALQLGLVHSSGKFADKKAAAEDVGSFFSGCPASTDRTALWLLSKFGGSEAQARVAAALRGKLATESNPEPLKKYETLWGLEFQSRPPQQHAELRRQIGEDLKRIEPLNPKPDAEWLEFLKNGYKQAFDAQPTQALEDRIVREFPASQQAFGIVAAAWRKTHKEPEDGGDTGAWRAYNKVYEEALKGWIRDFAEVTYLGRESWFYTIVYDFAASEKDGIAAAERYVKMAEDYEAPQSSVYSNAAEMLLDHRWQTKRALELLRKAAPLLSKEHERASANDSLSEEDRDKLENSQTYERHEFAGLVLRAARLAGRPGEAQFLRTSIETGPPKNAKRLSGYWLNRGRLAVLENRMADGLTYYQRAIATRRDPATPWRGHLQDDLTDEARALWKEMGGTETAWAVWSNLPDAKPAELKEGRWEKPTKALPAFELYDLTGKTWKLQTLEGKSVMINLWATWCGPCNVELPHLQKLYEQVKERPDLQILTFNIDADLGLVEPFIKEKGYTFPVLPAGNLVHEILDEIAIPQNWIVDPHGAWRWTQVGFDGAPNWIDAIVQRLESVKSAPPQN